MEFNFESFQANDKSSEKYNAPGNLASTIWAEMQRGVKTGGKNNSEQGSFLDFGDQSIYGVKGKIELELEFDTDDLLEQINAAAADLSLKTQQKLVSDVAAADEKLGQVKDQAEKDWGPTADAIGAELQKKGRTLGKLGGLAHEALDIYLELITVECEKPEEDGQGDSQSGEGEKRAPADPGDDGSVTVGWF